MIGGNENTGREFQPFVDSTAYFLFLARTDDGTKLFRFFLNPPANWLDCIFESI
jgi:hypothetical protein